MLNILSICALSFYFAFIINRSKKSELLVYYLWMHFFAMLVLAAGLLNAIAPNALVGYTFTLIDSMVNLHFSITFLLFGKFYNQRKHLGTGLLATLLALPLACLIALSLYPPDSTVFSSLHHLFTVAGCILQLLGCLYLINRIIGMQKRLILRLLIMGPVIISLIFRILVSIQNKALWALLNPIFAMIIFTLIFIGTVRYGLFETLSIGVIRCLELYHEAIIVMDARCEVIYSNLIFERLDDRTKSFFGDQCRQIILQQNASDERQVELTFEKRLYTLSIRPLKSILQQKVNYVCILHDDTTLKSAIRDLKEKNEELRQMNLHINKFERQADALSVIEARNILAKEIHDVMGHSLNLVLHTLESNKVILDACPGKAIQRLEQVLEDIDAGMREISMMSKRTGDPLRAYLPLNEQLNDMARRLIAVNVRLEIIGVDDIGYYPPEVAKTIYRLCQEACTNAIKHGKADNITLSVRQKKTNLYIHIVDNGMGCMHIKKGNGLKGMEERVERLGGSIRFNTLEDNGFLIKVIIPLRTGRSDPESAKGTVNDDQRHLPPIKGL